MFIASVRPSVRPSVRLSFWNQNLVVWEQNLTMMQWCPRSGPADPKNYVRPHVHRCLLKLGCCLSLITQDYQYIAQYVPNSRLCDRFGNGKSDSIFSTKAGNPIFFLLKYHGIRKSGFPSPQFVPIVTGLIGTTALVHSTVWTLQDTAFNICGHELRRPEIN